MFGTVHSDQSKKNTPDNAQLRRRSSIRVLTEVLFGLSLDDDEMSDCSEICLGQDESEASVRLEDLPLPSRLGDSADVTNMNSSLTLGESEGLILTTVQRKILASGPRKGESTGSPSKGDEEEIPRP